MAIVDFTNPAARTWFAGHLRRLMDLGIDSFKTDFGERIPFNPAQVKYHDGPATRCACTTSTPTCTTRPCTSA